MVLVLCSHQPAAPQILETFGVLGAFSVRNNAPCDALWVPKSADDLNFQVWKDPMWTSKMIRRIYEKMLMCRQQLQAYLGVI